MRILVLGGDGFCGWPTALHLSAHGHDVTIADDLSRRDIMDELGAPSLTPIAKPADRLKAWHEATGRVIQFHRLDVCEDTGALAELITSSDAVVHFAEQSSAPYSMRSPEKRRYTVLRNLAATNNILNAALENRHVHIVHLGTMGVYGYGADRPIPEGWIDWEGEKRLHPFKPGSIYHATKCMDAVLFEYCARNDGLKVTDLHQGIVWGTQTEHTRKHPALVNRFSWDGDYGTVLNRFLMQAAVGHSLTVHGTGGQTRGFIHISDTVRCIAMALDNPAGPGEYRVFNQAAESRRVMDLAEKVSELTGAEISCVDNPRKEAAENELDVENAGLRSLGWEPVMLDEGLMTEVVEIARFHEHRADPNLIPCNVQW